MLSYLDPGSGAVIVQAVAGGVAGFFVLVKMFGRRMFGALLFWRKPQRDDNAPETTTEAEPDAENLDEQAEANT